MATLKFYPYKKTGKSPIYIRLKIGRQTDIRQSTGLTIINAEDWKDDKQRPKATTQSNKNLKTQIQNLDTSITESIDKIEMKQR